MKKTENYGCPLTAAMNVIGGKWKSIIIYNLNRSSKRFGQLDVQIPGISRKVLTMQLTELCNDGIVLRTSFAESPPRVEYQLTKKGKRLVPILHSLCKWGSCILEEDKEVAQNIVTQ